MTDKNTLICVVGPTAIGKTAMGITIAKALNTVVLSADSRQFYREMAIGTAKPVAEEMDNVPHYFIDNLSIHDNYSAGDFETDALSLLQQLFTTRSTVVLVGGSGLFVNALCTGFDTLPKPLPGVRDNLNSLHEKHGLTYLQDLLKKVDPEYYGEVDIHNSQRVIRALEVYESTGKPFSAFRQKNLTKRPFDIITIGLNTDRAALYQRINDRVDRMMEQGLLDEVKQLVLYRQLPPLLTVGYAELFEYLDGAITLQEAVEKIKQNTRRFAKRQLTWFRRTEDTTWFEPDQPEAVLAHIQAQLKH